MTKETTQRSTKSRKGEGIERTARTKCPLNSIRSSREIIQKGRTLNRSNAVYQSSELHLTSDGMTTFVNFVPYTEDYKTRLSLANLHI